MADHAHSDDPAVQAQLDRLAALSPGRDVLGLERIGALMQRLGNPHLRLPPIFHVAGTNGKGSTCAVLRAALETDGKIVHAYTSPHLVRFNERIRLSSRLISDEALAHYLNQVLNHAEGLSASFFEVTTAAAFLAFAEHPADACIIEVGLGGRLDATNILPLCAASGIAQLGVDHEGFLGSDPAGIAREKAGIARPMRPLVTMDYPIDTRAAVADVAEQTGATLLREGRDWSFAPVDGQLRVLFGARQVDARLPALPGAHQFANSALAIAMLMAQDHVTLSTQALIEAPAGARWPARLQSMAPGPLTAPIADRIVTLDGGHNVNCAMALARHFHGGRRQALIMGMLANKDAAGWLRAMAGSIACVIPVPIDGHDHHPPATLAAMAEAMGIPAECARDLPHAVQIAAGTGDTPVLIAGSLYLAGTALRLNQQHPE